MGPRIMTSHRYPYPCNDWLFHTSRLRGTRHYSDSPLRRYTLHFLQHSACTGFRAAPQFHHRRDFGDVPRAGQAGHLPDHGNEPVWVSLRSSHLHVQGLHPLPLLTCSAVRSEHRGPERLLHPQDAPALRVPRVVVLQHASHRVFLPQDAGSGGQLQQRQGALLAGPGRLDQGHLLRGDHGLRQHRHGGHLQLHAHHHRQRPTVLRRGRRAAAGHHRAVAPGGDAHRAHLPHLRPSPHAPLLRQQQGPRAPPPPLQLRGGGPARDGGGQGGDLRGRPGTLLRGRQRRRHHPERYGEDRPTAARRLLRHRVLRGARPARGPAHQRLLRRDQRHLRQHGGRGLHHHGLGPAGPGLLHAAHHRQRHATVRPVGAVLPSARRGHVVLAAGDHAGHPDAGGGHGGRGDRLPAGAAGLCVGRHPRRRVRRVHRDVERLRVRRRGGRLRVQGDAPRRRARVGEPRAADRPLGLLRRGGGAGGRRLLRHGGLRLSGRDVPLLGQGLRHRARLEEALRHRLRVRSRRALRLRPARLLLLCLAHRAVLPRRRHPPQPPRLLRRALRRLLLRRAPAPPRGTGAAAHGRDHRHTGGGGGGDDLHHYC